MTVTFRITAIGFTVVGLLAVNPALGQSGPDLIVSNLSDCRQYGREGPVGEGIVGLGMATSACNIGDSPVTWYALPAVNHPLIPLNLYRLSTSGPADRFEQIGYSWIKHGFGAAQLDTCGRECIPHEDLTKLGVGCSDPYSSAQNATPCLLGPRSAVNPYTGGFSGGVDQGAGGGCEENYPARDHRDHVHDEISHRLQVHDIDLLPEFNAGARYFGSSMYISLDEYLRGNGNQNNNASYREFSVSDQTACGAFVFTPVGETVTETPAIEAWSGADHVIIEPVPLADGRAVLAFKVTDLGSGIWHYEYAIENLNLDRGVGSFAVPVPEGVAIWNVSFHAPGRHAPELHAVNYADDPWAATITSTRIEWSTAPFVADPTANALRWGFLYNFRFDANAPPADAEVVIGFFKTADAMRVTAVGPGAAVMQDCNGNGIDDRCDISCEEPGCSSVSCGTSLDCNSDGIPDACTIAAGLDRDCNSNGTPDECDLAAKTSDDCNQNGVPDDCPEDPVCDDGRFCTGVEACVQGVCTTGASPCPGGYCSERAQSCGTVLFHEDFESGNQRGWNLYAPGSTASTGDWVIGSPHQTMVSCFVSQPGSAYGGNGCAYTGPNPGGVLGLDDVDNGIVYLVSPAIDVSSAEAVELSYVRWFFQLDLGDDPTDFFVVEVSDDNGTTWVPLETLGPDTRENRWSRQDFRLNDFVALTSTMRIRFGASDGTGEKINQEILEAAIDDVIVADLAACVDDAACDDGNLCSVDRCEAGRCTHEPTACPQIVASDPPAYAIDARQPGEPGGGDQQGWRSIIITLDQPDVVLTVDDIVVTQHDVDGQSLPGPDVVDVADLSGAAYEITLARPLSPGIWTKLRLADGGAPLCLGFLPGDVDQDGTTGAGDIGTLVDCLNLAGDPCAAWRCDIDRAAPCSAADIGRLVDLLNGAGSYQAWLLATLGPSPCDGGR